MYIVNKDEASLLLQEDAIPNRLYSQQLDEMIFAAGGVWKLVLYFQVNMPFESHCPMCKVFFTKAQFSSMSRSSSDEEFHLALSKISWRAYVLSTNRVLNPH